MPASPPGKSTTPASVLWIGYVIVLGGLGLIATQVLGPWYASWRAEAERRARESPAAAPSPVEAGIPAGDVASFSPASPRPDEAKEAPGGVEPPVPAPAGAEPAGRPADLVEATPGTPGLRLSARAVPEAAATSTKRPAGRETGAGPSHEPAPSRSDPPAAATGAKPAADGSPPPAAPGDGPARASAQPLPEEPATAVHPAPPAGETTGTKAAAAGTANPAIAAAARARARETRADPLAPDEPPASPATGARAGASRPAGTTVPPGAGPAAPRSGVLVDPPTPAAPASPPPVRLPDRAVDRLAEPETAPPLPGPVRPRAKAASLSRGNPTLPQVVLSFDGGSGANSALPILDALDAAGIRTTFFLTGEFVRSHPDVTRQIAERGHEVGNHTDDHPHLTLWNETRRHTTRPEIDAEALRRELTAADASFRMVTGRPMAPLWRAPYGEINSEILGWAADLGYRHVGWTTGFDSLDWVADPASSRYRTPEEFVDLIASRATSGSGRLNGVIILMHLNSWRPEGERFGAHLGSLVRVLRAAGYELVTAGTLLRNLQPSGEATSSR